MEAKYNRIGKGYNQTRKADQYLAERLHHHLRPEKNKNYLDIGCGTGNYTLALYNRGVQIMGIDPSSQMLSEAQKKNDQIDWRMGSAAVTSLESNRIDGIIAFLTIHHWPDLNEGFAEINRILKDEGRIVIFTSTPEQTGAYWLSHYFPKMLEDSKTQMPSFSMVEKALRKSGMKILQTEKYFVQPTLEDHFLYCGKQRPELYLKAEIRNGISSFSDLANREEIEKGLINLEEDLKSARIENIIADFENEEGDYLFIVAEKFKDPIT